VNLYLFEFVPLLVISRLRSPFHSLTHLLITPALIRSESFEGSLPFFSDGYIWCRFTYLANFRTRPIHSHPSKPQPTSRYTNPYLPPDQVDDHPLAVWVLPTDLHTNTKSFKNTKHRLCLYCDFQWRPPYTIRDHLEKCHPDVDPDVILRQADSTRRLCMYCDVEWNHTYQYKDHLREHHPNVDPDAVLGEPPWSQRRDKIIARFTTTMTTTTRRRMGGRPLASRPL
jgi:hypothetical protein